MESNSLPIIKIEQKTLKRITNRILEQVRDNLNINNKLGQSEMSEKIRKIIEIEVNKNEN